MAGRIYLSDEYRWSAAPELYDWVVGFLRAEVTDPASRPALDASVGDVDLRSLPPRGRDEALRVLRERLVPALDGGRGWCSGGRTGNRVCRLRGGCGPVSTSRPRTGRR